MSHADKLQCFYVRQVNGVKLADILFSLLCVHLCTPSPVFNSAVQAIGKNQEP